MTDQHPRDVKSYVKRPGRMTPAQQRALDTLLPELGLPEPDAKLDPADVFGRSAPLLVEIGFGNGDSLVDIAAAQPDWNVLGIEVHEPGIGHCLLMAERAGLQHFRVSQYDAVAVLTHQLPRASVTRLNLYFPDPWPKKRHHKRRLVQPKFLELVDRVLAPEGALHIATDWENYAEQIDAVLSADARLRCAVRREHSGERPYERPQTKFERRGLKLGHRIWDWCWQRAG
ncbi:MAG: tRNA (guanosine(46)-N7)-methyltransferase TrmB [Pseudomonadota bacterium]